jgi:hypothetical protein
MASPAMAPTLTVVTRSVPASERTQLVLVDPPRASTADVVAVEARKCTQQSPRRTQPLWPPSDQPVAQVVSLTERRLADPAAVIGGLPPDPRPLPSVARYDELLTLRRAGGAPPSTGRVS